MDLSEATFGGILHWAYTCTALLRAVLASLLAAVCEVYAGSSVGEQPFMFAAFAMFYGRTSLHLRKVQEISLPALIRELLMGHGAR